MPVPKIRKGEDEDKFISRCISQLTELDPNRKREQIIAICYSQLRKAGRKVSPPKKK